MSLMQWPGVHEAVDIQSMVCHVSRPELAHLSELALWWLCVETSPPFAREQSADTEQVAGTRASPRWLPGHDGSAGSDREGDQRD